MRAILRTALSKAVGMAQIAGATLTGTPINPATSATIDQQPDRAIRDLQEAEEWQHNDATNGRSSRYGPDDQHMWTLPA